MNELFIDILTNTHLCRVNTGVNANGFDKVYLNLTYCSMYIIFFFNMLFNAVFIKPTNNYLEIFLRSYFKINTYLDHSFKLVFAL